MAVLETKFDIEIKRTTGEVPDMISDFNESNFTLIATKIQFLEDSIVDTEYDLINQADVVIEALDDVNDVAVKDYEATIRDINRWIGFINTFTNLKQLAQSPKFTEELEKDNGSFRNKFTLASDLLLDVTWTKATETLDFLARSLVTIPYQDFINFIDSVNKMLFVELPLARK